MSYSVLEPSVVDKALEGKIKLGSDKTKINKEESYKLSVRLLEFLKTYQPRLVGNDYYYLILKIKNKFKIIIIPLGKRKVLTGETSLKVFSHVTDTLKQNDNDSEEKLVLIYFTPGGKILLSAYLFLGHLIEKHNVGILFVNGDEDEILEVVETLNSKGSFIPQEEDYIRIKK